MERSQTASNPRSAPDAHQCLPSSEACVHFSVESRCWTAWPGGLVGQASSTHTEGNWADFAVPDAMHPSIAAGLRL